MFLSFEAHSLREIVMAGAWRELDGGSVALSHNHFYKQQTISLLLAHSADIGELES